MPEETIQEKVPDRRCLICSNVNHAKCGAACYANNRKFFIQKAPCPICGRIYESHVCGPSHHWSWGIQGEICHNPRCEMNHVCMIASADSGNDPFQTGGGE